MSMTFMLSRRQGEVSQGVFARNPGTHDVGPVGFSIGNKPFRGNSGALAARGMARWEARIRRIVGRVVVVEEQNEEDEVMLVLRTRKRRRKGC